MKIHRFFINTDFAIGPLVLDEPDLVHQISRVLRLAAGESIMLCNDSGIEALATITEISRDAITLSVDTVQKNAAEPRVRVTLYCAILKRENFEWAVQKATELGVSRIVPLITKRTVKLGLKKERLQKIIQEAAEQSGRGIIPKFEEATEFSVALAQSVQNELNIIFDPSAPEILTAGALRISLVGIWIGPEGGWDESEIAAAKERDMKLYSLGALTLRAETAATIATYAAIKIFS